MTIIESWMSYWIPIKKVYNKTFFLIFCIKQIMIMKLPSLSIIGDTEGQDKLCGRMDCHHNLKHLCRYFDRIRDDTDNPFVKYKFTKMIDVIKLISKDNEDALKDMAMFSVKMHGMT